MKKKLLILGASSEIGLKLIAIMKDNYEIVAHANNNLLKIKKIYKEIKILKINFEKIQTVNQLKKKIKSKINFNIDAIINLTGKHNNVSFIKSDFDSLISTTKVNTIIPLFIVRIFLKKMIQNSYGRIVFCSSIGTKFGGGLNGYDYSFSKHASEFIPKYIRDLAKKNIIFNTVRIGACDTKLLRKGKSKKNLAERKKQIPVKRFSKPTEIAKYLAFLLSKNNTYITNQIIDIAGGE